MYIDDFIWLEEIVDKLAVKHGVTPEEVEEVFSSGPVSALQKQDSAKVRMCIWQAARPTRAVTWLCSLFRSRPIARSF
jgi:hypothetical protein